MRLRRRRQFSNRPATNRGLLLALGPNSLDHKALLNNGSGKKFRPGVAFFA